MRNAITWSASPPTLASPLERNLAAACLALLLALNIGLISWKIFGVPVRGLLAVGMLGAVLFVYPDRFTRALSRFAPVLWLAGGLALLGTIVSLVNGTGMDVIVKAVSEVHLQIAITVLVVVVLAEIAGMKAAVLVFAGVVGASVLIALLQMLDVDSAWSLREALGRFQREDALELATLQKGRPLGIAYSPIQFSTHACLAFAVYAAARERGQRFWHDRVNADLMILFALGALCVAAFISGTRSPLLGAALFFLVYAARRPGSWLLLLIALGGAALVLVGPILLDAFQSAQPRIVRTDDNSATGRGSLIAMGILLFTDNPLGYGFGFSPTDHWPKFWQELYTLQNPSVLKDTQLHNYILNMINTYGIGLLLAAPVAYSLLMRARTVIIFYIPYIIHIMFHNFGPYWNDTPFWFTVAALAAPLLATGQGSVDSPPQVDDKTGGYALR